ncbi:MAG TPA: VCBS repeat-containing protein, partial [Tepidisphaeraceae bacterium]|nr:VCBS repeat-containing protein [Tepidisphaeraceae bacterium]
MHSAKFIFPRPRRDGSAKRSTRARHSVSPASEPLETRRLLASVSFAAPVTTNLNSAQFNISAVGTGDLNNDNIPDLLVGHNNGSAQFFRGTSTGQFSLGLNVGPGAQILALADFNGDGNLDAATAVGVLPGNGNGTFGSTPTGQTYTLPLTTVALYAADVNGDGNQD